MVKKKEIKITEKAGCGQTESVTNVLHKKYGVKVEEWK